MIFRLVSSLFFTFSNARDSACSTQSCRTAAASLPCSSTTTTAGTAHFIKQYNDNNNTTIITMILSNNTTTTTTTRAGTANLINNTMTTTSAGMVRFIKQYNNNYDDKGRYGSFYKNNSTTTTMTMTKATAGVFILSIYTSCHIFTPFSPGRENFHATRQLGRVGIVFKYPLESSFEKFYNFAADSLCKISFRVLF